MIRFLRPSKLKLFVMLLVWASMWSADKLEDVIAAPLIEKVAPELWCALEGINKQVDEAEGEEEDRYVKAGVIVWGAQWLSRGLFSYVCACIIIVGMVERRGKAGQRPEP